jgi:hypothetical protein
MPRRTGLAVLTICAAALVGYAAIWPVVPAIDGDSSQYLEVARDLADGRLDDLHDRPPGYPVLLALTGSTEGPTPALKYVQLLLHAASVWLLCGLCHQAGVPHRWLIVVAAILVLPPFAEPAASVMTETLAQAALVAGVWLLVTGLARPALWLVALASLAFACAALTRPVYQLLPFALAAAVVAIARFSRGAGRSVHHAWRAAAVLILGSSTVLGAYAWFNLQRFGFFGVTFTTGFHLSTKTIAFVERLPDEHRVVREILLEERHRQVARRGSLLIGTQTIWHARPKLQEATGLSQVQLSRHMLRLNLLLIRRAPLLYLQEVARSAAVYWFPAAIGLSSLGKPAARWAWVGVHVLIVGLCFVQLGAIVGVSAVPTFRSLLEATAPQIWGYALAGSVVLYTMALSCGLDIGDPRQRRPADVFLVLMCAIGALVWRKLRESGVNRA